MIGLTRVLVVVTLLAASAASRADIITLSIVDQGFYDSRGSHFASNESHPVGYFDGGPTPQNSAELRNWFLFDLSGVTSQIVSAELRLYNPINGYDSPDASETYALHNVSAESNDLRAGYALGSLEGISIWQDLGTGTSFGSRVVLPFEENTEISVALNAEALAELNTSNGFWSVGGRLSTISGDPVRQALFVDFSGSPAASLVLTTAPAAVPEPSSLTLAGVLGGIGLVGRLIRRRGSRSTSGSLRQSE